MKRPMEGWYLRDGLKKLAEICAAADGLSYHLEPLSQEDKDFGAEPLTLEQIKAELSKISILASSIALEEMQATDEEWNEANLSIE